ncbi:signal transduction histidine kinase [Agromyces sp. 3263]|uniref:sensor histidine kinase n=1 Tax=Agromyces sp. 3263 TaxID=2817750 RepID=UPI002862606E|nr:histidine kinase [Agromyces sp. 3263]MDR6904988.1 signal transduction histidine kinase [Agromyces sp. 3263]
MTGPLRSIWDAPAATPPPPRRVWRDWVLVVVVPLAAIVEAAVRPEVPSRWVWAVVLTAIAPTLLWRRTHPLAMLAIAFGLGSVFSLITGGDPELVATAAMLLLVYAAVRWGSGRAMVGGAALVLASSALSFAYGPSTPADLIGAVAVLVTTISLGVAFRWRAAARARELDRVKLLEREQLARDLHDTVAHHVSAIAIQAQAGTAVAATDPDAAARVLRVIEAEASRTLDEMRSMVRILRRDETVEPAGTAGAAGTAAAARAPSPAIADLRRLAVGGGAGEVGAGRETAGPVVDVRLEGDVAAVPPVVAATVYRIAQEAVTNARRHARGATRVDVAVVADADGIRVDVHDDGEPAASGTPGYGLRGMAERAALLGGTLTAGAAAGGGWSVAVTLPRAGWST